MARRSVSDGGPFEDVYGYCRGVRVGDQIHISGTTADPGLAENGAGMYAQTMSALGRVAAALAELGASTEDVVRTVTYITDMALYAETARAHSEVFGEIKPAGTLVEVSALAARIYLVEVEAYAVVED